MSVVTGDRPEPTRWTIHGEQLVDDTRRLRLSIAQVELPDGVCFEQYVLRMPKAAMTMLLDDAGQQVLMIWRHRFVVDCWTWELPGGYNEAARVEWIGLDSVRDRIARGEIIGAGTQIGLLYVLAFRAGQAS